MNNIDRYVRITMPDATWAVPVMVIAENRAAHYMQEFGGDMDKSLAETNSMQCDRLIICQN